MLLQLLVKPDDEKFVLGGRSVNVEFCFLCDAIRVLIYFSEYNSTQVVRFIQNNTYCLIHNNTEVLM